GVRELQVEGTRVRCQVDAERLDEVLRHLSAAGGRSLVSQPPTLEELVLRHSQTDVDAPPAHGRPVPAPLPDRCGRPHRRPAGPGGGAAMNGFAGTWQLFRLGVRRDRVGGTVWVLGLLVFRLSQAGSTVL